MSQNAAVQVRLLLGPAGSGKTFACLQEIREVLAAAPDGPPLVLLAPKQATYQLERQLLAESAISGYTRLQILSFERLAHFIFDRLHRASPEVLDEEGRLMVLRSLLATTREDLRLFRASARLTGFAQQLSLALHECQRHQLTPEQLHLLADQAHATEALSYKLRDLATLLKAYLEWLDAHQLQDADGLLSAAAQALQSSQSYSARTSGEVPDKGARPASAAGLGIEQLWVDGFAEWSPQELELLVHCIPHCQRATLAFCLDRVPPAKISWLSSWSVIQQTFERCRQRLQRLPGAVVSVQELPRQAERNRFSANPVLRHLEAFWTEPQPLDSAEPIAKSLKVVACASSAMEATLAAREVLSHVQAGGRYREVSVVVRKLEGYHQELQRTFSRYDIPFFLDRRESVAHHPLAELTRGALRTIASQWRLEDWLGALKSGLVPAQDEEIDRLENEALARGWEGAVWHQPLSVADAPELNQWLAELQGRILPPFQKLAVNLGAQHNPTGRQLAQAIREFWQALSIEQRLQAWADQRGAPSHLPNSVHATVWEQMNAWLKNLELAFPTEPLLLRDWLPILDAGLANLSVGVIPPALDQVLIGAIDRSRNPDIKLALVLGLNERVFPAAPQAGTLLTDADREELAKRDVQLGATVRQQLGRERFLAYIACTRARERVVLTFALQDADGTPLSPSPFLARVRQLFPTLEFESMSQVPDWKESLHTHELVVPLLQWHRSMSESRKQPPQTEPTPATEGTWERLARLPALAPLLDQVRHFQAPPLEETLSPEIAAKLYGDVLKSSVSRLEQFAACPFKFFVHSGLRAQERKQFELDVREQGSFQHDVLACFHGELQKEDKRWRDITPAQARDRIAGIARSLLATYREGLLQASEQSRFTARVLTEALQDFVETLVHWMASQYQFDPVQVELPFGQDSHSQAWTLELEQGRKLELSGRIDRVDIWRDASKSAGLCVVVDYKSSQKQLDPVLLAHGLQLQLLTYLNVLRHWPDPRALFGVERLIPAGGFYVNLRGKYDRAPNRSEALADEEAARMLAYRHSGRFDSRALPQFDARTEVFHGDQFNYRLTLDRRVHRSCREALNAAEFQRLLDFVEAKLKKMGHEIYSGRAQVDPYRKGTTTACDQCDYRAICRIDPWTHAFRVLKPGGEED